MANTELRMTRASGTAWCGNSLTTWGPIHTLQSREYPSGTWLCQSFTAALLGVSLCCATGGRPGRGPSHHHLREGEGHRLLQALHDSRHQHPLPQAQRHQSRRVLVPQPAVSWHLDVRAAGLPRSQLCPLCYCQVITNLGWKGEVLCFLINWYHPVNVGQKWKRLL